MSIRRIRQTAGEKQVPFVEARSYKTIGGSVGEAMLCYALFYEEAKESSDLKLW